METEAGEILTRLCGASEPGSVDPYLPRTFSRAPLDLSRVCPEQHPPKEAVVFTLLPAPFLPWICRCGSYILFFLLFTNGSFRPFALPVFLGTHSLSLSLSLFLIPYPYPYPYQDILKPE